MIDPASIPDASDEVTTNTRKSDEARRRRNDADVLRRLMHTPEGRSWLYRKLEVCQIYGNAFMPGQADTTAFQLGMQNVGKMLLAEAMDASGDLYLLMRGEAREEEERVEKKTRERNKENSERDEIPSVVDQYPGNMPIPDGFTK